mgnify:CR=1 FL=1
MGRSGRAVAASKSKVEPVDMRLAAVRARLLTRISCLQAGEILAANRPTRAALPEQTARSLCTVIWSTCLPAAVPI